MIYLVCSNKKEYTFKFIGSKYNLIDLYKKKECSLFTKIIRKLIFYFGCGSTNFLYNPILSNKNHNSDDVFIFFDECKIEHRLLKKLKRFKGNIIIYYWNPIVDGNNVLKLKKHFKIFTYSAYDSKKYGLSFNQQFLPELPKLNSFIKYDAIFVGKNKGRLSIIEKVSMLFDNSFLWVVADGKEKSKYVVLKKTYLNYEDYLNKLCESKCIIELLPSVNAGLTLRAVESIYYDKKLITNNVLIINEDFYNSNNIYVLDDRTTKEDIYNFLDKPFIKYDNYIKQKFCIDEWLERFFISKL